MSDKPKIKLSDIFNRNLIIILLVQIFSDMSVSMQSAFMNMGAKAAGIGVGTIGIAASLYTIAGLIMRMPSGAMADSDKKKAFLIFVIAFRTAAIMIMGTFGMGGDANYLFARTLYGMGWSMGGVVLPAVVAMMMDRKVMGSTYAVLALVQQFTKQIIKAVGVSIYNNQGIVAATIVDCLLAVVAIVLILFLNFNDPRVKAAIPHEKRGMLKSINFKYMPISFVLSIAAITFTLVTNFDNVVAQDRGIELVSILSITAFVSSAAGFVSSFLCDFIHPKYVLVALYCCLGAGTLIVGSATAQTVFMVGEVLVTVGISYSRIISIFLFKNCELTEKGSVQATNFFATDIISIFAGTLIGALVSHASYSITYNIIAGFTFLTAVIVLFFGTKLMKFGGKKEEAQA